MTGPRIVICDDDGLRANRWAAGIAIHVPRAEIIPLPAADFVRALDSLSQRRETLRTGQHPPPSDNAAVLDSADILIVDFDLTPAQEDLERDVDESERGKVREALRGQSGEEVAYLARCFSRTGYIVVVNQEFNERTFDLTMQRFAGSFADLNVVASDLMTSQLWLREGGGFMPWSWPCLAKAGDLHKARVAAAHLDAPILESLGIADADRQTMTSRQLDLLGDDPEAATFDSLVSGPSGLQPKDQQPDADIRRSISAAAIARWLETQVLPAQNVLVDGPHVAQRFPQMLGDDAGDTSAWQTLATDRGEIPGVAPACAEWLSHRGWLLRQAREALADVSGAAPPDLVFCEDTSSFVPLGQATEVETDLPGPFVQRFIRRLEDVQYHPRSRLLT